MRSAVARRPSRLISRGLSPVRYAAVFLLLLREMRQRWGIHVLAMLLIALIVSLLVAQSSLNGSAEEKIFDLSHKLGQGMLVVPEGTDLEQFYAMRFGDGVMPDDFGDRIKASPLGRHASMVEPRLYGNLLVSGEDVIIVGQRAQFPQYPGGMEAPAAIGSGISKVLGLSPGDSAEVGGVRMRVFAVLDPPPKGFDMAFFVPLSVAQRILGAPGGINALHMGGCWCELDIAGFAAEVERVLPGTVAITVDGMARAQIEMNEVMRRYSFIVWTIGGILSVGTIAFLVLYMIYRSEREIGLLLSIGISPGRLAAKNVAAAVATALVGAAAGYGLTIPLMSWVGKTVLGVGLAPSWSLIPYVAAAALVVALLAASGPCLYMARLDPTKLMRGE